MMINLDLLNLKNFQQLCVGENKNKENKLIRIQKIQMKREPFMIFLKVYLLYILKFIKLFYK